MNFTEKNEIVDFFRVNANFGCISVKQLAYKDGADRRFLTRATKDVDEIKSFILDIACILQSPHLP